MANPNDVSASIVLEDKTTAVLKQVERNTKKTADEMSKSGDRAGQSFVKWGSAVALVVQSFKKLAQESETLRTWNTQLWDNIGKETDDAIDGIEKWIRSTGLAGNLLMGAAGKALENNRLTLTTDKINQEIENLTKAQEKILASSRKNVLAGTSFWGISEEENEALLSGAISDAVAELANRMERLAFIRDSLAEGIDTNEAAKLYDLSANKIKERSKEITDQARKYNEESAAFMEKLWDDMAKKQAESIKREQESTFEYGYAKANESFGNMALVGEQTAQAIGDSFSNFFFDAFESRTFEINNLLKALASSLSRIFFNQAGLGVSSLFGQALGGGKGSSSPAVPVIAGGSSGQVNAAPVYNVNINAVDAQSFEALAARNPRAIAAAVQASLNTSPSFRAAVAGA